MRKLDSKLIVVLILVFTGVLYFLMRPTSSLPGSVDTYGPVSSETSVSPTNDSAAEAVSAASKDASIPVAQPSFGEQNESIQKLQSWIAAEAKGLDQPHVDTKQKDLELKGRIENFSETEKKYILDSAHDIKRSANERILAAYMLVLDQSQASVGNLQTLASKALPDFGSLNAHSEAEIRRGQELAVRYMAVDELVKRASGSSEALETLKTIANSGDSAEIRSYTQRVLKQIK